MIGFPKAYKVYYMGEITLILLRVSSEPIKGENVNLTLKFTLRNW